MTVTGKVEAMDDHLRLREHLGEIEEKDDEGNVLETMAYSIAIPPTAVFVEFPDRKKIVTYSIQDMIIDAHQSVLEEGTNDDH